MSIAFVESFDDVCATVMAFVVSGCVSGYFFCELVGLGDVGLVGLYLVDAFWSSGPGGNRFSSASVSSIWRLQLELISAGWGGGIFLKIHVLLVLSCLSGGCVSHGNISGR